MTLRKPWRRYLCVAPIFLLPLLLGAASASAATAATAAQDNLARARALQLHDDPTWQRLLYFDTERGRSEVLSDDYFLAPDGATSPAAELARTIEAFFEPAPETVDAHALCRFPARYLWLSRFLTLPGASEPERRCPNLARWARFDRLESLTLIMVSGYFGNPASSFGHILLKLDNGEGDSERGLLDLGINYGALVPENEPTVRYIFKGLLGGYQAGFSDRDYYTQDLVYSSTEFRDMWAYRLALDEFERRLLASHVWEIAGKKFRYFFLKENCGYRMAQLLSLATGADFVADVDFWYAPIEAFHGLDDFERQTGRRLIAEVRFLPSSQRVLYATFAQLSDDEAALANRVIVTDLASEHDALARLPVARQAAVLEALLAYYQYRLAGSSEADHPDIRVAKDAILRYRLARPPALSLRRVTLAELPAPSLASRPSSAGLALRHADGIGAFSSFGYTAFDYDAIGNNTLEGSELVVFDLAVGFDDQDGWFLDRLDIVRARKINRVDSVIHGEDRRSWRAAFGLRRETPWCVHCTQLYLAGGFGRARRIGDSITAYALLGGSLNTGTDTLRAEPVVGLIFDGGAKWKMELTTRFEHRLSSGRSRTIFAARQRYSFTTNHELQLNVDSDHELHAELRYVVHY